jgi:nucleotide-binding universal stress UspA family protein
MTTSPPFVDTLHDIAHSGRDGRGRPHVVLVIGTSVPRARAMHDAVWLGRHLRAEMLVVSAVEYRPPRDELVAARVELTRGVVRSTTEHLVEHGVDAAGTVLVARDGLGVAVVEDFANRHEADLLAITSQHPTRFWVFGGSGMARHLMRAGRRPVVVIPDHRPGARAWFRAWLEPQRR